MNVMSALILATAIVVGGFLVGGRYDSNFANGATSVVDRFTGAVRVCDSRGDRRVCRNIRDRNSN